MRVCTMMELLRGWLPLFRVTREPSSKKCRSFPGKIKKQVTAQERVCKQCYEPRTSHAQVSAWIKMKKENGRKKTVGWFELMSSHVIHLGKRKRWKKKLTGSNLCIHKFLHKRTQIYTAKLWGEALDQVTSSAQSKCQLVYSFDRPFPLLEWN